MTTASAAPVLTVNITGSFFTLQEAFEFFARIAAVDIKPTSGAVAGNTMSGQLGVTDTASEPTGAQQGGGEASDGRKAPKQSNKKFKAAAAENSEAAGTLPEQAKTETATPTTAATATGAAGSTQPQSSATVSAKPAEAGDAEIDAMRGKLNELIKNKKGGAVAGLMAKYSAGTVRDVPADKRADWFVDADKILKGEAI